MTPSQKNLAKAETQSGNKAAGHEQRILDTSSIGVLITRISDGTILYANKAIGGLLGIPDVDSVIGSPVPNFYWDPEERLSVIQRFQVEGSISQYPLRARRPDGSMVWVSISIQPFNYEGEQVLLSEIVDITERKRVEALLQTMIENAPEAIVVIDLASGLFTEPNQNAVNLYALSREELVKVGPADVSPPVQPDGRVSTEKAMEYINAAMQGEMPIFEWMHRNARGEDIPCEVRLARLPGNLPLVRASVTDITERKQTEKAIRENEERFHSLYDNATIGLYRTTPDGRILMINPTGLKLLGFDSFEELAKRNLEEAGFEEVDARKKFRERLEREGIIEQESVWTKKDGTPIFVRESSTVSQDEDGNVLYYDGSFEDITAHKQAEEALRASEERFKRFTEATVEGLVFHEQGKIIDANPAGLAMFGLTDNADFIGRNLMEFIVPESHKMVLQQMQLETVLPYEIQCVRRDGSTFPVETSTRTYKVGDQTIRASSIRDITERRQMEQTLRDTDVVYSAVVMQAKDGVVIIQDNVLQFMNKSMGDMLGYTLSEMENTPFINYVVSENKPLVANRIKAHLAGEDVPPRYEIGLERKDGMVVLAELSAGVKEYRGKPAYVAMIRDISERKKSEEALRESEQRFGRFIESTIEGLIFHEQGRIVDANPAAFGMFGFSENSEFIGKNLLGFIAPESHEMILKQMPTEPEMPYDAKYIPTYDDASSIILESGPVHYYEIQCMREDGSTFPAETSTYNYGVGNRTIRATSIRDITERKKAEEELKRNVNFTNALLDAIPTPVFYKDKEGRYQGCNRSFTDIMGVTSEEIKGKTVHQLWPSENAEIYHQKDMDLMRKVEHQVYEATTKDKDGIIRPVIFAKDVFYDESGNVAGLVGAFLDITERKHAEQALRESQQLLQLVMDNIPQSVFWKDKNLTYIGANQAFAEDAGFASSREMVGKSDFDMPWKEQAELYRADDQRVLESGEIKLNYEEPQTNATGKVTWLRTSKIPMQDVNGNIFGVLGSYEDITERKQADQALRESQQLLQLVMDNIPQAVFWKDKELTYLGANQSFAEDAGFASPQELVGKHDLDMPWKEQAELYRADDQKILDSGEAKIGYEEQQTAPTGNITWLRTSKIPMRDANDNVFAVLGMYEDITEQRLLRQQVQESFERRGYQVQISTEISQEIASATELSDLFSRVVTLTKERLGYYHTQLLRYDTTQDAIVLINGYGKTGQRMLEGGHKMPMGSGLIGTAAESGQTVLRPTLADDPDWHPNPLLPETKGEIAVPIKWQDNVLGVLDVQSDQAGALTEDDRLLLEGLCGQIAIAMQSAELVKTIRENEANLAEALRTARLANWEYDVEKDLFTFNDQFYSIFHTTAEKAGGYQLSSARYAELFVHPDDMGLVGSEIGKSLSSTERVYNTTLDHRIVYEDGGIGYITVKVTVERDEAGKVIRYYGANQDITERKQAEEALRRSEQEMAERLEEINHLYQAMSREGWKTYRETADLPTGFIFDQTGARPVEGNVLESENFTSIPMKVLGGEVVGTLAIADDPRNPTSPEDLVFLQQVSDQVALALEGARFAAQTQSALAQTEKLSEAGLLFTRATDLQEVVRIAVETLGISKINRAALETFNYNSANEVESMDVLANWWDGTGHQTTAVGTRYTPEVLPLIRLFLTPAPMFIKDAFQDERIDSVSIKIVKYLNIHAVAVLPLFLADKQIGVLLLESEEIHEFNQDEIRLFSAMGPQISTVLENRRQFERAQKQAEREGMLNIISQKIQSATTVEAVLQIAARELGHALGAPMTIAQLSMKDRK